MTGLDPWYEARQRMVEALVDDLQGTRGESTLTEAPLERFIVGILHPQPSVGDGPVEMANEVPDEEAGVEPDASYDPGVSFAHLRHPSSIGLTFGVGPNTEAVELTVSADRYQKSETGDAGKAVWELSPLGPLTVRVPLVTGTHSEMVADGLEVRVVVRESRGGVVNATVVLLNTLPKPLKGQSDASCWFRPEIVVQTVGGTFKDRRPTGFLEHLDDDERSGELLYRSQRLLAVGHGVGVTWPDTAEVDRISTTFFPSHDLALAQADRDDVPSLSMPALAQDGNDHLMRSLATAYAGWIEGMAGKPTELDGRYSETASRHLDEAASTLQRIQDGIALIERDPDVRFAFRAMNTVMQQQRVRQEMLRSGSDTPPDIVGSWRPFQLAFILLNLKSLANPEDPERELAEVLWFPTGGGKTEAYLGLIAFSLILRRLRGAGEEGTGAGVGVIMRYTLRLLTLQQFERAAGLLCALENWRVGEPRMKGKEPFFIGLWVGQGATPNSVENAARALRKRANGEDPGDLGDPVQLLRCPWCGTRLTPHDYTASRTAGRMSVLCPSASCDFSVGHGLPVHLIDSDVYEARPSLLIGTVDKFAMLAWQEKSGRLFGSSVDAPPDLIVQDELHLISGPLGTLVGLYETAVDYLATDAGGHRPKLVASTATIRRAAHQVRAVFDREARQFPPAGVDADDSFFAVDAPPDVKGTRRYVGVMAPSASHATLLIRTYAALLQAAQDLDATPAVRDAYWTILGYFNSLRVLGAAYIQTVDDVRDRVKVVARRRGSAARETGDPRELTSRKRASEIPVELEALQTSYPSLEAPDVVLATNMISVGVDVDRLGLMAVMGQPQTTSEYIQATSRVGRRHPGLVFTLYNASRSRDLSHYESFTSYHRALYRQVEATGATPFAARALDRGLHGLLVTLGRHLVPGAASDKSVAVPVDSDALDAVVQVILERARSVAPETVDDVADALDRLVHEWSTAVSDQAVNCYARWPMQNKDVRGLMVQAGSQTPSGEESAPEMFPPAEPPWPTLTSLRNVDRESTLKVVSGGPKEAFQNEQ